MLPAACQSVNSDAESSGLPKKQLAITQSSHGSAEEQQFGLITLKLALNLFEGATGCHEWEAGFLLAEFVLGNPDLCRGRTHSMASQCHAPFKHAATS